MKIETNVANRIDDVADCLDVLWKTHLDIENGHYDDFPNAGALIMQGFFEKARTLVREIADDLEGGLKNDSLEN